MSAVRPQDELVIRPRLSSIKGQNPFCLRELGKRAPPAQVVSAPTSKPRLQIVVSARTPVRADRGENRAGRIPSKLSLMSGRGTSILTPA
jgi:hypothetical protein